MSPGGPFQTAGVRPNPSNPPAYGPDILDWNVILYDHILTADLKFVRSRSPTESFDSRPTDSRAVTAIRTNNNAEMLQEDLKWILNRQ